MESLSQKLKNCEDREDHGWKTDTSGESVYLCKRSSKKLGWRNAVSHGVCVDCDQSEFAMNRIASGALKFALADYKASADQYRKLYGSRTKVLQRAIEIGVPHDDILIALATGVANGVPKHEVERLAIDHGLITE